VKIVRQNVELVLLLIKRFAQNVGYPDLNSFILDLAALLAQLNSLEIQQLTNEMLEIQQLLSVKTELEQQLIAQLEILIRRISIYSIISVLLPALLMSTFKMTQLGNAFLEIPIAKLA